MIILDKNGWVGEVGIDTFDCGFDFDNPLVQSSDPKAISELNYSGICIDIRFDTNVPLC